MSTWELSLSNNESVSLELGHTHGAHTLEGMLKHLRHLPVPFVDELDNPYNITQDATQTHLLKCAKLLDLSVDADQLTDQSYLNSLHEIYEKNYDGDRRWLHFHESIHALELLLLGIRPEVVWIDWKEQAGRVETPITDELLDELVPVLHAGDVFVAYAELGKPPYTYWRDHEPADIARMCELAAPWTSFKPRIGIALADRELHPSDWPEFCAWFESVQDAYWQGLKLPARPVSQQQCVLPVGRVQDWQHLKALMTDGHSIQRIRPC